MFCNKCGIVLPEDAGFCHKCGYKIPKEMVVQESFDKNSKAKAVESCDLFEEDKNVYSDKADNINHNIDTTSGKKEKKPME